MTRALLTDAAWQAELAEIEAESLGWLPLAAKAYVHPGRPNDEDLVVDVVGVPSTAHAGLNVLLLLG